MAGDHLDRKVDPDLGRQAHPDIAQSLRPHPT
jgi:hypothetical protein